MVSSKEEEEGNVAGSGEVRCKGRGKETGVPLLMYRGRRVRPAFSLLILATKEKARHGDRTASARNTEEKKRGEKERTPVPGISVHAEQECLAGRRKGKFDLMTIVMIRMPGGGKQKRKNTRFVCAFQTF